MKVKFPLKMSDGTPVRTIEELREHFDLKAVLGYYASGKLVEWLEDRYYDDEAKLVKELDPSASDFNNKLCEIFGAENNESEISSVSLSEISDRNDRIAKLKQYTSDDEILQAVDSVAFTQNELEKLVSDGVKKIYLCGEHFDIPKTFSKMYIGVNNPEVDIPEYFSELNVKLVNVSLDREETFKVAMSTDDPVKKVVLLRDAAELGSVEAMLKLGDCYFKGKGVERSNKESFVWYLKAAELGNARAQNEVGKCYSKGYGVNQDYEKSVEWFKKSAEQEYDWGQYNLAECCYLGQGIEKDKKKAFELYLKAAEQGNAEAQYKVGVCYDNGDNGEGIILNYGNYGKAVEWFKKSAKQGNAEAQYRLATCYRNGHGVREDKEEAFKWYLKSAKSYQSDSIRHTGTLRKI